MESRRFDALTRSLAASKTRRGLLGGLAALIAGVRAASAQTSCPPGQVANSKGDCSCPAGTDPCPDGCFNKKTDFNNCGRCGFVCGEGQICQKGECKCPRGASCCPPGQVLGPSGVCVAPTSCLPQGGTPNCGPDCCDSTLCCSNIAIAGPGICTCCGSQGEGCF